MSITIHQTKYATRINVTGDDALAFFHRMAQPLRPNTKKLGVPSAFDDLTAAKRRQLADTASLTRTGARVAL